MISRTTACRSCMRVVSCCGRFCCCRRATATVIDDQSLLNPTASSGSAPSTSPTASYVKTGEALCDLTLEPPPSKQRRCASPNLTCAVLALIAIAILCGISSRILAQVTDNANAEHMTLEGDISLDSDFADHIGGFCFGRHTGSARVSVGSIQASVYKTSLDSPWRGSGTLYLAAYDDESQHWQEVLKDWNQSSIPAKLTRSNVWRTISMAQRWSPDTTEVHTSLSVFEHVSRHWQMVLIGSNFKLEPGLRLRYKISGIGSLTHWGPGVLKPQKCPSQRWKEIRDFVVKYTMS